MSQRCTKCGTVLHNTVKFCPICGQRFSAVGAAVPIKADTAQPGHSRTKSIDTSARNDNSRTQSIQQPTQPMQPPTQPIQPPTQPMQPPTQPIQQRTQPMQQSAQAAQSPTLPIQPPAAAKKTRNIKLAAFSLIFMAGIGLLVIALTFYTQYSQIKNGVDTVESLFSGSETPAGLKAGKKASKNKAVKVSDCLIIYPKQMRKPNVGEQLGGLYPFSDYLAEYAEKSRQQMKERTERNKRDPAAWKSTNEYKVLQNRLDIYNSKDRELLAKSYGRRCYIEYKDNGEAWLYFQFIEAYCSQQLARYGEDRAFNNSGIVLESAKGTYYEEAKCFVGEGKCWNVPRGITKHTGEGTTIKIHISPQGAVLGVRDFYVYDDSRDNND